MELALAGRDDGLAPEGPVPHQLRDRLAKQSGEGLALPHAARAQVPAGIEPDVAEAQVQVTV